MTGFAKLVGDAERIVSQRSHELVQAASLADLNSMLSYCRNRSRYLPYNALPELKNNLRLIGEKFGAQSQAEYMQGLLARLVLDFCLEELDFKVTDGVRALYEQSLQRILAVPVSLRQLDDRFFKDLALASGHLFPAGERVVEPYSALQRALLYSAGTRQSAQFIRAYLRAGGYRPLFRLHVHLSESASLSRASWHQTCIHLTEMLLVNPSVKGIVGASWFYDPGLIEVSPHLAFINEQLRGNGAFWFFSHAEGASSGAFAKSESRKRAFEQGRYIPRNYVLLWPRVDALAWLQNEKKRA